MSHNLIIQEGALFISDAHDSSQRSFFYDFLLFIQDNPPPQLFLMGDMFDLLVGRVDRTVHCYQHYIDVIERIATTCEVYYFEGNHDFDLARLFSHVRVIPLWEQPLVATLPSGRTCLLLHGDKYERFFYRLYTSIIRHPMTLTALNCLDHLLNGKISSTIQANQGKKQLCRTIDAFEERVRQKIHFYPKTDVIAEGHYHQNHSFMVFGVDYINFSSFACNQSYFSVQSSQAREFAQKQLRGCNG